MTFHLLCSLRLSVTGRDNSWSWEASVWGDRKPDVFLCADEEAACPHVSIPTRSVPWLVWTTR